MMVTAAKGGTHPMTSEPQEGSTAPTRQGLRASGWRTVIDAARAPDCWEYWLPLSALAKELGQKGITGAAASVEVLARVCALALRPDDDDGPLVPTRGSGQLDLQAEDLAFLADVLDELEDDELTARVGDVLWLTRRHRLAAEKAARAYLASSLTHVRAGRIGRNDERLRRTMDLAADLGRNNHAFKTASAQLQAALADLAAAGETRATIGLLRALLHHREGDAAELSRKTAAWAEAAVAEQDWVWAQHWWFFSERYAQLAKDEDWVVRAQRGSAGTFVLQADAEEKGERYGPAAHWLHAAVKALQHVKGTREERDRLRAQALELQERSLAQLEPHSTDLKNQDLIRRAEESVTKEALQGAIVALVGLVQPTPLAWISTVHKPANNRGWVGG